MSIIPRLPNMSGTGGPTFDITQYITGPISFTASEPVKAEPEPIPTTEFGAPEFSIEPVLGARSFAVDKLGRLRGVSYDSVWLPGENESGCRRNDSYDYGSVSMSTYSFTLTSQPPTMKPGSPPPPHSLVGCKCGFYGYYDGSNDYYQADRVSAVVEGYGEVVIGTRGFRATKARIVALTIPGSVAAPLAMRVRHNYRDIPFYDSFEAMVTAHPTSIEQGITPETDPDFWTRS